MTKAEKIKLGKYLYDFAKDYYPDVLGSYIIEYVESLKKNSIC
jgi:hypothetical protein